MLKLAFFQIFTLIAFVSATATLGDNFQPFKVNISQSSIHELHSLLKASRIGPLTYESTENTTDLGLKRGWLVNAKNEWSNEFDWKKHENVMNSFPHFTTNIEDDDGQNYTTHFIAVLSKNETAIPIMFIHGWPGSFLEFLPILGLLQQKYTSETLPYHVIIPSLPGFGFSSAPTLDRNFRMEDVSRILNYLMVSLGFGDGYAVQGGDLGSEIARVMNVVYEGCKVVHLNFCIMNAPANTSSLPVNEQELEGLARAAQFELTGSAYATEHATRPSTMGLVVNSNPLALLAWIGEKFLEFEGISLSLDVILQDISLYWFTGTYPSSIYLYRSVFTPGALSFHDEPKYHITKPFGYSWFPMEIAPVPQSWAATTGNLVFYRQHTEGGHFAALEEPKALLADVEEFLEQVWVSGD